jgi:tRNA(adenine34) deaminase
MSQKRYPQENNPVWQHFTLLQHQGYMQAALQQAESALPTDVPVGALVLNADGAVVGRGYNHRERDNNPLGHAELMAISEAATALKDWRLNTCILYVTLEPCPMCANALLQARIGKVVFGAYDTLHGAAGSHSQVWRTCEVLVLGGVLQERCEQALKAFFKQTRKT